jgi:hypothetical protein
MIMPPSALFIDQFCHFKNTHFWNETARSVLGGPIQALCRSVSIPKLTIIPFGFWLVCGTIRRLHGLPVQGSSADLGEFGLSRATTCGSARLPRSRPKIRI